MRLFTLERQLLTGVFGGLGRVVVRLQKHRRQHGWTCPQPSPSLCSRSWLERGPYSLTMKMKMRHTHTCHSQTRVRANRDKRATWMETSLRSSVLSFESCYFPRNGSSLVAEEETRGEANCGRAVHTGLVRLGGRARGTAAPLAWMGQQDDRGPHGGMAAVCLPTLALDADTATMAG